MSNTTVDGFPVLNPFPWPVFLSSETAYQVQISSYIVIGSLGAFVWDLLNNIRRDYMFAARHVLFRWPTVIYFLSKLSSFGFVLASAIFESAPISNCFHSEKALTSLYSVAVPSTALLFFFRARAVYGMNPFAIAFFGLLWLSVLGGCLTTITGISGANIGPSRYCTTVGIKPYAAAGTITPLVNDSIVFFAISFRLSGNSWARRTLKNGVRVIVFGDYLPAFSKSMLQDGQVYFLTTVTANLLTVIMLYASSLSGVYRTMFTIPNVTLMNIMACRVYRDTLLKAPTEDYGYSSSHSCANVTAPISLSLMGEPDTRSKQGVDQCIDDIALNSTKPVDSRFLPSEKDRPDISRMV